MPHDTILRPSDLATTALHPDQMIVFATPPSLAPNAARSQTSLRRLNPSPQHLLAVAAFGLGFAAGQIAMTFIR